MIVTLTINPAIDRNVTADRLVFEDRAYIVSTTVSAGGRGINASCVINSFGRPTKAVLTCGGDSGRRLDGLLANCGFPVIAVPVASETRTNLTITDRHGLTVKLNEVGAPLHKEELDRIEQVVEENLAGASWLMLCGSVPPGVPAGFYAKLIRSAQRADVSTLLDTDGEALREGIEAGPTAVAPNQHETERLLSRALLTRNQFLEAALAVREMGAQSVIMSLGSRGAIGAAEECLVEVLPPRIDSVCPIGAGDAMAAAFIWALDRNNDFPDAVRWGVAAGTASARLPGLSFASLAQTEEIYRQVEVRRAA